MLEQQSSDLDRIVTVQKLKTNFLKFCLPLFTMGIDIVAVLLPCHAVSNLMDLSETKLFVPQFETWHLFTNSFKQT
jgi:hypothetical protein